MSRGAMNHGTKRSDDRGASQHRLVPTPSATTSSAVAAVAPRPRRRDDVPSRTTAVIDVDKAISEDRGGRESNRKDPSDRQRGRGGFVVSARGHHGKDDDGKGGRRRCREQEMSAARQKESEAMASGISDSGGNRDWRDHVGVRGVRWRRESLAALTSGLSSMYAMLLICVYMSFVFTELVTFPKYQLFLEKNGFFAYLYALADAFLVYVLFHTVKTRKVVENHKSHGSLPIRFGAVIFGLGTLTYLTLEAISFAEVRPTSPCFHACLGVNVALAIVFVLLQTYLVFVYPRLNLMVSPAVDRFGLMHVVATNIILWIRTLMKESLHEIAESEEEAHKDGAPLTEAHDHGDCNFIADRIRKYEHKQAECMELHNDILGDALLKSSPYLYPFVIEYALIGASVAFVMWRHVEKGSRGKTERGGGGGSSNFAQASYAASAAARRAAVRKPNPRDFIRKGDWSHSFKGMMGGVVVMLLALLNLALFFGLDGHLANEDEAEFFSKTTNTVINLVGIAVLALGIVQIQKLHPRSSAEDDGVGDDEEEDQRQSSELDLSLLRFTAFFAYMYLCFTVITGAFNRHVDDFPNALHVVNGVVEAAQITAQIVFIIDLKNKVLPRDELRKPGRQVTVFLFLLNLAQWIVFTFEIQKVRASMVEANFYGFMPWVIIQRVTLPLTVFFRFHSAVVNMELWKEIYCE